MNQTNIVEPKDVSHVASQFIAAKDDKEKGESKKPESGHAPASLGEVNGSGDNYNIPIQAPHVNAAIMMYCGQILEEIMQSLAQTASVNATLQTFFLENQVQYWAGRTSYFNAAISKLASQINANPKSSTGAQVQVTAAQGKLQQAQAAGQSFQQEAKQYENTSNNMTQNEQTFASYITTLLQAIKDAAS